MEREILFKAKRLDNGEWVIGCLLKDGLTGQHFIHAEGNSVNESDKVNEEGFLQFVAFEVDESTICQYTGKTDKNGNKIWENDIVTEDFGNEKGIVRFGEFESQILKNIGFNIDWISNISYRQDICWWAGKCEVIGNIFDNLELLEEQNE